jgi:hypothetical protein
MESILAGLVAFILAVSSALFANPQHVQPQPDPSSLSLSPLCRLDISGSLDCAALQERLQQVLRDLREQLQRHRDQQPAIPSQPPQQDPAQKPDGCTTERSSGPGWSQTTVRCSQQSSRTDGSGNRIAVSSSSVNVSSTTSNDVP